MAEVEAAIVLLDELNTKDKRACIETLIRIFRNVVQKPEEPKYRTLKITNKVFHGDVWRHEAGRALMEAAGWEIRGETVQLPSSIDLTLPLEVLLANREVKPDSKEWVSENKVVVPNAAKVHEEQLRQKALAEKEKEMVALKKDMAERKAIADRILAEHRNDRENKKVTKPSKATPLGKGGGAKMSEMLPEGGGG